MRSGILNVDGMDDAYPDVCQTGEPTHVFDVAGRGRVVVVCFWFTFARVEMDVDSASLK